MLPPIRGAQPQAAAGAQRRAGPGRFSLPEDSPPEAAAIAATGMAQGMLALQDGWSPAEADAAARRRGQAVLRELDALQLALLRDGPAPGQLGRLAMLTEGEAGADPVLREIMQEISLRARVELARQGG
jgi:hypothetical protein